ncbi:add-1, partial [Pristionchus pacificus]|uniref:Class II aldolase/adducin N-terminal domain-containing protein n=1 Tax=Pristionchus pacificus TaxID=54126 RepID=A0A8R1YNX9_PRIPA
LVFENSFIERISISVSMDQSVKKERERPYRIDCENDEYIKDLQRPAVIKADISEMERRKKVHELLDSKGFCRQLEMSIKAETEENTQHQYPFFQSSIKGVRRPIADLTNEEFTSTERLSRNNLACFLRVIDHFHWSSSFNAHVSLRISKDEILTQPIGLFYNEIRASSLVKVRMDGTIIHQGVSDLRINEPNFSLHSSIFSTREDIQCIAHLQSPVISAVSSLKCGLLPVCPEATFLGPVGYFDYFGSLSNDENICLQSVAKNTHVVVVRNNGVIVMGESIQETALYASHVFTTCEIQIRAAKAGIDNIHLPSRSEQEESQQEINGNTELNEEVERSNNKKRNATGGNPVGTIEWESFMRILDSKGMGTGHEYKLNYNYHNEIFNEPIQQLISASSYRKSNSSRWMSSPVKYQRVDVFEKGSATPKIITKWISDSHDPQQSGNAIRISTVHQFAPLSPTTKDFKEKQRNMKERRLIEPLNAGPQSNILNELYTGTEGPSQIPEDRTVVIGASRGIIERDYRSHAQIYRQQYAANPFREHLDGELNKYLKEIENRSYRSKSSDPAIRTAIHLGENFAQQTESSPGPSKATSSLQLSEKPPKDVKGRKKSTFLSYLRRKLL